MLKNADKTEQTSHFTYEEYKKKISALKKESQKQIEVQIKMY